MKKVGILTFSYSSNGGSVMQAYALQKTISSLGDYDVSIINYTKNFYCKPKIGHTVFPKSFKTWTPKNIAKWSIEIIAYPVKMRKYISFFKKYYNGYSKKFYLRKDLPALNDIYDRFVTGSDQVWNYESPQVDDTYFLDFVTDPSKKISYAASFGKKTVPEERRDDVRRFLSDFSSISVREPDGIDIVMDVAHQKATLVLDPSLLLDKEEYQKLSISPSKSKYVYLYLRKESAPLEEFAQKIAQEKGLKVIKVLYNWVCGKKGKPKCPVGPGEWLGYIENADYVVTNSFHGICFSIIFEKEFYINFLGTNEISTNSRLEGILRQFNLSGRHINDIKDFSSLNTIDYTSVRRFKEIRKAESISYLKNALEGRV